MIEKLASLIFRLFLKIILNPMKMKIKYQFLWKKLYTVSLSGMNIGSKVNCRETGEKFVMKYIESKLSVNQEIIIFDVGANIGQYTLELLNIFDTIKTRIICIEPSVVAFQQLQTNTMGFNNVSHFNFGIGEKNENLMLYTDFKGSDLASLYSLKTPFRPFDQQNNEIVEVTSISSFCREKGIKRIDFLKLDIEGHELKALKGALDMIESNAIKYIQFEFGSCNIDSGTYFRDLYYLLNRNYEIYRIVNDGIFPITAYSHSDEIFLTTNYFAKLRENKT